jgi:probable rRNA maturation factor
MTKKEEHIKDDAELSVTFVDKQEIQEINRTYRDKDKVCLYQASLTKPV